MTNTDDKRSNVVRPDFARAPGADGAPQPAPSRAAFIEDLYRKHFADISRTLRRVFGEGPPEPEELAQQAFETITALDRTDHIENPRAFLFQVAVHAGYKAIRRARLFGHYASQQRANPDLDLEEIHPERIVLYKEKVRALADAMDALTLKQREIVVRARFHGQTYAEIAAAKGWSQADISRQLNSALKILADAVARGDAEG